jgi:hypothetical protein
VIIYAEKKAAPFVLRETLGRFVWVWADGKRRGSRRWAWANLGYRAAACSEQKRERAGAGATLHIAERRHMLRWRFLRQKLARRMLVRDAFGRRRPVVAIGARISCLSGERGALLRRRKEKERRRRRKDERRACMYDSWRGVFTIWDICCWYLFLRRCSPRN